MLADRQRDTDIQTDHNTPHSYRGRVNISSAITANSEQQAVETCTGMGIAGIPRNPRDSHGYGRQSCGVPVGMQTKVVGLPRGWNRIVQDSRGNAVLFNFYAAPAATNIYF